MKNVDYREKLYVEYCRSHDFTSTQSKEKKFILFIVCKVSETGIYKSWYIIANFTADRF